MPDRDLGGFPEGAEVVEEIRRIRRTAAEPKDFWPSLVEAMSAAAGAVCGVVLLRGNDGEEPWRRIAVWAAGNERRGLEPFLDHLASWAERAAADGAGGGLVADLPAAAGGRPQKVVAVRLKTGDETTPCVGLFLLRDGGAERAGEILERLLLIADVPETYRTGLLLEQAKRDVENFSSAVDLMVSLNREKKFLAVALTFCNELAARLRCDRVSVGWLENEEYVRLRAISHTERFDRKMDAVTTLEAAMEESLDQDDEILLPAPEGSGLITRDHEIYARSQQVAYLASAPLRVDGKAVAVVTCERASGPFTETEIRLLRLCCDLAARRLDDLKRTDRWFGARWYAWTREKLGKLVGVEHTFAKVLALVGAVVLGILVFGRMEYRVEAPFEVHTDMVGYVPAPYDGYIREVFRTVGDPVKEDEVLLELDTRDLLLEEAAAAADQTRYLREAEKARADGDLASMRIARALAEQAAAKLALVRYQIGQSRIRAPFDGVIVEGDLRERVGAPVRQGDVLFRVARPEQMYVKLKVDERDIHEVREGAPGQIAFASRPAEKFPVRVERIDPAAEAVEGKNVFTVRCGLEGEPQPWWRPGMTGVAKVNAGKRNILWIYTHRTIDFLRLRLWM